MKFPIVIPVFQIRGMSIDEALKQLSFVERKGSAVVKEVGLLLSQLSLFHLKVSPDAMS